MYIYIYMVFAKAIIIHSRVLSIPALLSKEVDAK